MKKISNNKKILTAISCASLIVILLVWWLYCDVFKLVPNAVFPGPDKVINTFITKLYSKKPEGATIFDHAFASLKVCLLGYVLGAIVGIPLGIMMAWNKWVDRFARPLFDLIRPVPGLDSAVHPSVWYRCCFQGDDYFPQCFCGLYGQFLHWNSADLARTPLGGRCVWSYRCAKAFPNRNPHCNTNDFHRIAHRAGNQLDGAGGC